jgi:hypothetical protein
LDGMSDEVRVLDGSDGVRGLKERYWMRFLKGMVTDRNRSLRLIGASVGRILWLKLLLSCR